jgi:hypothetical protein
MRPPGRCHMALSAVQSVGLAARRTRVHRRGREYLLLGSMQLAGAVGEDMRHAGIAFLGDRGSRRDDDGRIAPRDGDPR